MNKPRKIAFFTFVLIVAFVLTGCNGFNTNTTPQAFIAGAKNVKVGEHLNLEAQAYDPDTDDRLTCQWELIDKPVGSKVQIVPNDIYQNFNVDKAGVYIISMVVSDGKSVSLPAVAVIIARDVVTDEDESNGKVIINCDSSVVAPGQTVNLTAVVNFLDPTVKWVMISKPEKSAATLLSTDSMQTSFVADVSGEYEVLVYSYDGTDMSMNSLKVEAKVLINDLKATSLTGDSATLSWSTNTPVIAYIEYGLDDSYKNVIALDTEWKKDFTYTFNNLLPDTSYYCRVRVIDELGNKGMSYNGGSIFRTTINSISVSKDGGKVVYDKVNSKAYILSRSNETENYLVVIDLLTLSEQQVVSLQNKPADICLAEDRGTAFLLNYNGTVSELSLADYTVLDSITLPVTVGTSSYFQISYQGPGYLYITDETTTTAGTGFGRLDLAAKTYEDLSSIVSGVKQLKFTADQSKFYALKKVNSVSKLHAYQVNLNGIELVDESVASYIDEPVLLCEAKNWVFAGGRLFDAQNLQGVVYSFTEDILLVNAEGTVGIGYYYIYDLTTFREILVKPYGNPAFIDENDNLYLKYGNELRYFNLNVLEGSN